ncbi:MAG: sigma-70 family RNA polymerase sigma factor [Acidobacteria bacterium]|nr:sigma-70 family RNA polymerase sigma factor [Acidobacteriota bacterium]
MDYLELLNESDRKMFIMRHYQGRSESEISRSLKISARKVHRSLDHSSRRMFRHLRSLRQKLCH